MKQFLKNNINFLVYLISTIILELVSLFVLTKNVLITSPWLCFTLIGIIFCLYNFCKKRTSKNIIVSLFFMIQCILNIVCVVLYENTGTLFDFNMFQVVGEGTAFLNTININYPYIIFVAILFIVFFIFISIFNKFEDKNYRCKLSVVTSSICLCVSLISQISLVICDNKISEKRFTNSLYVDTHDKYTAYGTNANFVNEVYKMLFFNKYNDLTSEQIEDYIYEEISSPTSNFGISEGNNLITILAESFEWFAFVSDPDMYPNGANLSEEQLDELYPNIRAFYNMSVIMNNHHSQNKTDISEDEALLGAYPSNNYINYIFPNNSYPTSIANTLKINDSSISNNFFHNNTRSYYNRNKMANSLGYDNLYFMEEMITNGVHDYMNDSSLDSFNLNLDSEMFDKMKDYMFPTDKRFNTHITTLSTHGNYVERANMKKWLDKIDSLNIKINDSRVKNYMAGVMEFDYALGLMIEDLENKNLLDNTTIVIFSDHNAYLSDLTYYVKNSNLKNYKDKNFNNLFRVPLMIYDSNIPHQIVNKFTTTYDIAPTIFDMFGIRYYTNVYHGNSIFSENESVLYSKAFDIFIANGLYFSNINNILYKKEGITNDDVNLVEQTSLKLLKKIYYTNHIFEYNFFESNTNKKLYESKLNEIN